jgi:hypothetical protein
MSALQGESERQIFTLQEESEQQISVLQAYSGRHISALQARTAQLLAELNKERELRVLQDTRMKAVVKCLEPISNQMWMMENKPDKKEGLVLWNEEHG